jgi:ribosomal-protein-alanine N-acetyltransferase
METMRHFAVHIRWMIKRDMEEVFAIENLSFDHPWSEDDFLRCLRQRNCIGMVAEFNTGKSWPVLGFMVYELHEKRLDLINFAVHPEWRLGGVATQMAAKLASKVLGSHRRSRIRLHVRESNLPAQLFFKGQGYRAIKIERGYYEDSGEDAYLMQFRAQVLEEVK